MAEQSYEIKKIKIIESLDKIQIECTNTRDTGKDDLKGIFSEKAAPEFYDAMKALTGSVANIIEAPELAQRLKPFAVTFHYSKDGRMGAIITAKLEMPQAQTETVINTPMRKCAPDDNAVGTFFTPMTEKRLWALEAEARKYLCGKRAQTSLFDGDTAGQANDETEQISGGAHVIPFGGAAREA
ncbi:hypothetical protein [Mitsuokella jalaludinii]|uniref:hypothetical protein n=1 Tax=Mitsuokella jalaludinii TaxID=187979 RepID=UPI003080930E